MVCDGSRIGGTGVDKQHIEACRGKRRLQRGQLGFIANVEASPGVAAGDASWRGRGAACGMINRARCR